jgi:hypothetical protein
MNANGNAAAGVLWACGTCIRGLVDSTNGLPRQSMKSMYWILLTLLEQLPSACVSLERSIVQQPVFPAFSSEAAFLVAAEW